MTNAEIAKMINALAARQTTVGALVSYLKPRLAMDAKVDLSKVLDGVPVGPKFKTEKPAIAARLRAEANGKLAKDASLEDVEKVLDMLDNHEVEGGDEVVTEPQHKAMEAAAVGQSALGVPEKVAQVVSKDAEPLRNFLKEKGLGEDDCNAAMGMLPKSGMDAEETPEEKKAREDKEAAEKKSAEDKAAKDAEMDKDKVTKPAMDAAIAAASAATEARVKAEVRATERGIRIALDEVRPYVGELSMAFDSADDVYRQTATMLNIENAKTIHASALPTIIKMLPKAGSQPVQSRLGMDAVSVKKTSDRYPGIDRIGAA